MLAELQAPDSASDETEVSTGVGGLVDMLFELAFDVGGFLFHLAVNYWMFIIPLVVACILLSRTSGWIEAGFDKFVDRRGLVMKVLIMSFAWAIALLSAIGFMWLMGWLAWSFVLWVLD